MSATTSMTDRAVEASSLTTVTFSDFDDSDLPPPVDADDQSNQHKLLEAVRAGDAMAVTRLINLNADVNAPDDQGRTALYLAAASGEAEIVRTLIDAGADTDAITQDGETPLMAAAIRGSEETIQLLLSHDANVRMKSGEGATAHDLAIQNKHDSIARLIADEIDRQNRERLMVTRVQFLLAKLGYRPGGIDGYLGPRTRHAIQRFQKQQGLNPDGRITEDLVSQLNREQKAAARRRAVAKAAPPKPPRKSNAASRAFRRASAVRTAPEGRSEPAEDGWKTSGDAAKKEEEGGFFEWLGRQFSEPPPSDGR